MITPSKTLRRPLKFKSPAELKAELDCLKTGEYKKLGNWNLPQACRHLAMTIEGNLAPAESDTPTPEETAMKEKFFGMVMGPDGMPEQLPIGNPALIPSDDCTEAEIDHLKEAFETLENLQHKCIKVGRCGPVPLDELTALHLAHCAHHLSFIEPLSRRDLSYASIDQLIADVEQLRAGYSQVGNWTLQQTCWHLASIIEYLMQPSDGPSAASTPEQLAKLNSFLSAGKIIGKIEAPEAVVPPADADDAAIDRFINVINRSKTYNGPWRAHRLFGPVAAADYHRLNLIHAAHHFSWLVPKPQQ